MEITNLLVFTDRAQLRHWFEENHDTARQCWVLCSRSKVVPEGVLTYVDVVEEALCFGWIDSTVKSVSEGRVAQRLTPRQKNGHWTDLNKRRCADLIERGLMTPSGLATLPR